MAGGTFKLSSPKVRPGTYVNVVNGKQPSTLGPLNGIAMIPLIGYDWGPRDEWIHLTSESQDAGKDKFGRSINDDNTYMMLLRLLFHRATEVYVYIVGGGVKATGTITTDSGTANVTAKYEGSLGNEIRIASVENPLGGFDVSVILGGSEVELFEGVETTAGLAESAYVDVSGDGALTAFASVALSGGTDDDKKTNASLSAFFDKAERIKFNCMALPTSDESLIAAAISKIRYIRNSIGWKCHAVVANTKADYEGVYNLTNAFEYEGVKLSAEQATAWLAGAAAAADKSTSLTYSVVSGATAVVGEKSSERAVEAIKGGETFFSVDEMGNVILEYDINSKVTFAQEDPTDINKGRPCRVYDTFANELLLSFTPGKFSNNSEGWAVMEGLGKAMLQKYESDGAIDDVDLDNDFLVDRGKSSGDNVYINVGIKAVDAAEKYYFTVNAR